jgi:hypothetical protein
MEGLTSLQKSHLRLTLHLKPDSRPELVAPRALHLVPAFGFSDPFLRFWTCGLDGEGADEDVCRVPALSSELCIQN